MKYYLCTTFNVNSGNLYRYNNFVSDNIIEYMVSHPDHALINTVEITKTEFDKWNKLI